MKRFLNDYVQMIVENREMELNPDQMEEIVNSLMDEEEIWEVLDMHINDRLDNINEETFGHPYEEYSEIISELAQVKAHPDCSYTIARTCVGNNFAELHWSNNEPYLEFSWRISPDEFEGVVEEDVPWFNFDLTEEEIIAKVEEEFENKFGR